MLKYESDPAHADGHARQIGGPSSFGKLAKAGGPYSLPLWTAWYLVGWDVCVFNGWHSQSIVGGEWTYLRSLPFRQEECDGQ